MIAYYLALKLKAYLKELRRLLRILLTLVLLITSLTYGRLFAELIIEISSGDIRFLTSTQAFHYLFGAIFILTLLRMIFPSYKMQKSLLPGYLPLSRFQHYSLSLLSDFISPYFFYIFIFLGTATLFIETDQIEFLASGLTILVSSHLIRRLLQYVLDFALRRRGHIMSFLTWVATAYVIFMTPFISEFRLLQGVILLIALVISGFLVDSTKISNEINKRKIRIRRQNMYLKLILNNPKARMPLLIAIIFKLLFLGGDYFVNQAKGTHFFDGEFIYWLFASPLILFTYIFNNVWGFWRSIWFNYELRCGRYSGLIRQSLRILIMPILIDILVTLPILLLMWNNNQFILIYYFVCAFFLIPLSMVWSLLTPVKIKSNFQMRGSTSMMSIMSSLAGVFLLVTLNINYWFYILIPVLPAISTFAAWYSMDLYKERNYQLMKKLFGN